MKESLGVNTGPATHCGCKPAEAHATCPVIPLLLQRTMLHPAVAARRQDPCALGAHSVRHTAQDPQVSALAGVRDGRSFNTRRLAW